MQRAAAQEQLGAGADDRAARARARSACVPRCPHFGVCGGCKMQHLHVGAQVAAKQRALEDALWHLGKVKPEQLLRPIEGPAWGYRYRARLSVRHVAKKGKVLVGFHERKSSFVADMDSCEVLPPHVSALLLPLRELVAGDGPARPPAADRARGRRRRDRAGAAPPRAAERRRPGAAARLRRARTACSGGCSRRGRTPCTGSTTAAPALAYALPEFGIRCRSGRPTSRRSTRTSTGCWWRARCACSTRSRDERVIDWFCGLGNFTLPIATQAREVLGIEGSEALVAARARRTRRSTAWPHGRASRRATCSS